MIVKRFVVNNMNEAMARIKYELGSEAVIISQRKIRKPGFFGIFKKKSLEVTAAVDSVKTSESNPSKNDINVLRELQVLKNTLNEMKTNADSKTPNKGKIETKLKDLDLNENIIKKILSEIKSDDDGINNDAILRRTIENMVNISSNDMVGTVVLVGPTGVGKTTTIAKLAGRLALIEKKKVGLITIDTYRIGAVDQLRTYAEIMNLPLEVVSSLKDMEKAILNFKDYDVLLIDTTGRSSKNVMQIAELRAFIDKAIPTSIHLVISCTTKERDIGAITEGFRELSYDNVIITKLDETTSYGSILSILDYAKKPLSYVTTGQNVPDDLKKINYYEVIKLILGEDKI